MKKQQLIFVVSLLYIISQVVLIFTIGKDLELIALSLGIFVACVVILSVINDVSIGRTIVESVSMRRAQRTKEDQEKMINTGYVIDEEFINQKRFDFEKRAPYASPNGVEVMPQTSSFQLEEPSILKKLRSGLLAQAPLFGGLTKLSEMLDKTEDQAVEKMLKQFGFRDVSASEARLVVSSLVSEETRELDNEGDKDIKSSLHPIKTSLNTVDFYDYIKRSMSGNDMESKRQAPEIKGMDILLQASSNLNSDPARVMIRMRGVHKGGGVRKCETCKLYEKENGLCTKIGLPVEHDDVCDGWSSTAAYRDFQ